MTLELRKTGDLEKAPDRPPVRERVREQLVHGRIVATAVARRRGWSAWRATQRAARLTGRVVLQLPGVAVLLVVYSPRGAVRLVALWVSFLHDDATAELRAHHAGAKETGDYAKASAIRSANLRARVVPSMVALGLAVAAVLAWTAPRALGAVLGVVVAYVVIRVSKQNGWGEIAASLLVGWVVYAMTPWAVSYLPRPPEWVWWTLGCAAVGVAGWAGRPMAKPLVTLPGPDMGGMVPPLRAPMVTAALVALGIAKMKDPDEIRLLMDVARQGQGYQIDLELPPAVTANDVIEKRDELAGALRRELGCVWPTVGPRHPGHLSLFVSDVPMATARQTRWPVAAGRPVNVFEPVELFTDQRGQWVRQTLAYTAWVIGAVPRMGKTVALRNLGLAAAFDPRVRLYVFDLKGTGDLSSLAQVAHAYGVGDEPEDIDKQLAHMREVRQVMRDRTKLVRELTLEENPDRGKVTDALATRAPKLFGPIVLLVDEVQVWTQECDDKDIREEFVKILRDLVKRGPALGIIPLVATQKPDAKSIPSSIADNASARLCLKVNGQISNDQILGTSSYQAGVRATQFAFSEKGVAYFRGDGAEPLVVRAPFIDAELADELAGKARALRAAAGLLTGEAAGEEPVVVLDVVADVVRVLADRARSSAHLSELAEWLGELRPDYADVDAAELGKRLRNRRIVTPQVKVGRRTTTGVHMSDLRKHDADDGVDLTNPEGE